MSDRILPGDNAARSRYATLTTALGGEPVSAFHRAALTRLVSWTDAGDIEAVAWMIRHRVGQATHRCRSLPGEVVPYVRTGAKVVGRDGLAVRVELPEHLARRVVLADADDAENGPDS
jgi:hypothetical protein